MPQMSVMMWYIDRVVFDEIYFILEVHCLLESYTIFSREKRKVKADIYGLYGFVIWEAERIRFQNVDILVDCCNQ